MINHKYAVETKVYDNGKVVISEPFKIDFFSESIEKKKEKYDYYFDVFPTLKDAKEFTMMEV
jgi:hypothetical protein